jgi:uncharacterized sodium:solute symporter family permease YidK
MEIAILIIGGLIAIMVFGFVVSPKVSFPDVDDFIRIFFRGFLVVALFVAILFALHGIIQAFK